MIRVLSILTLVLSVGLAQGQRFEMPEYSTFLLRYPTVQKELGLSSAVAGKLMRIRHDAQREYMKFLTPKPGSGVASQPSLATVQAQSRKVDAAQVALLNTRQKARLREIGLQYAGGFALADAGVSKSLRITPGQRKALENAGLEAMKHYNLALRNFTPKGTGFKNRAVQAEVMRKLVGARLQMLREVDAAAAKILAPAQLASWSRMKGKPFNLASVMGPVPARS
jgi:hypothetical protein